MIKYCPICGGSAYASLYIFDAETELYGCSNCNRKFKIEERGKVE